MRTMGWRLRLYWAMLEELTIAGSFDCSGRREKRGE
jgi:hypothetical protein